MENSTLASGVSQAKSQKEEAYCQDQPFATRESLVKANQVDMVEASSKMDRTISAIGRTARKRVKESYRIYLKWSKLKDSGKMTISASRPPSDGKTEQNSKGCSRKA